MKDYEKVVFIVFVVAVLGLAAFLAGSKIANFGSSNEPQEESQVLSEVIESEEETKGDTEEEYKVFEELPDEPPEMVIDITKDYIATLKTSEGDIEIDLFEQETPITVNNFVFLAVKEFYNNTIFHRVIDGFMIQGGDPTGTGRGSPGYQFDDELPITRDYQRGTLAMANAGPNTNGSQFFIMHQDYDLPKSYVIFGQVTKGMEVVDKIAGAEVTVSDMGERSQPLSPVKISEVLIKAE